MGRVRLSTQTAGAVLLEYLVVSECTDASHNYLFFQHQLQCSLPVQQQEQLNTGFQTAKSQYTAIMLCLFLD